MISNLGLCKLSCHFCQAMQDIGELDFCKYLNKSEQNILFQTKSVKHVDYEGKFKVFTQPSTGY